MSYWTVALLVFLVNIPFGYWRASVPKKSKQWFLAIHIPVPIVIALRLVSGIGFALWSYPLMVGAFFLGQLAGGWLLRFGSGANGAGAEA
jgi:hypothetical protein